MKKLSTLFTSLLFSSVAFAQEAEEIVETTSAVAEYTTGIPTMVYYYIGGLVIFMILYFVVTKFVKNKNSNYLTGEADKFAQMSDVEKNELLAPLFEEGGVLYTFQDELGNEEIIGVRQSHPYKTLGGAMKEGAKELWKQALWSMVGVKATYHDVGKYYLVVTDKNLHYFAFDKHDEIIVHETFPIKDMRNIVLRTPGTKEMATYSQEGEFEVLEFEIDGQKVVFGYFLQGYAFPNVSTDELSKWYGENYQTLMLVDYLFKKKLSDMAGLEYAPSEYSRK